MEKIPNKTQLLQSLQEGMTFLEACEYSANDPKELSDFLQRMPTAMLECQDAVRASTKLHLDMAADEAKKGQLYRAEKAREKAKKGFSRWNLWGSQGQLSECTTDQVLRTIRRVGSMKEAACGLGATFKQLDAYLEENDLHDLLNKILLKANW